MIADAGLYLLVLVLGLGCVHLVSSWRGVVRPLTFVVLGAGVSLAVGLVVVLPVLAGHLRTSAAVAVAWALLFGLGFVAVGVIVAAAWLVVVGGLATRLGRRGRRSGEP